MAVEHSVEVKEGYMFDKAQDFLTQTIIVELGRRMAVEKMNSATKGSCGNRLRVKGFRKWNSNGMMKEELIKVITHLTIDAAWPNAVTAIALDREFFDKKHAIVRE